MEEIQVDGIHYKFSSHPTPTSQYEKKIILKYFWIKFSVAHLLPPLKMQQI